MFWILLPCDLLGSGDVNYVPPPALTENEAALIMFNAKVSAEAIDGIIVYPGQTFSYWDTAGPFDSAHGYVYGYGVLNGKAVPALAGGVCVTSTALYRAALDAGLEIVERHPHGVPLAWAKEDDAAVSFRVSPDGRLERGWDFRFRNNLKDPVVILARSKGKNVAVELWSLQMLAVSIAPPYNSGYRLAELAEC
ncbi:MAG: VanW family protein [Firmicutes bacterium]|nr:VanW family protein [Bacillota bacterium]